MSNTSSEYDKSKPPSLKFDKPNTRQTTLSEYKNLTPNIQNRKSISPKPDTKKNSLAFLSTTFPPLISSDSELFDRRINKISKPSSTNSNGVFKKQSNLKISEFPVSANKRKSEGTELEILELQHRKLVKIDDSGNDDENFGNNIIFINNCFK